MSIKVLETPLIKGRYLTMHVSDQWTENGKPIYWKLKPLATEEHPDITGWTIVVLWVAIWYAKITT